MFVDALCVASLSTRTHLPGAITTTRKSKEKPHAAKKRAVEFFIYYFDLFFLPSCSDVPDLPLENCFKGKKEYQACGKASPHDCLLRVEICLLGVERACGGGKAVGQSFTMVCY